MRVSTPLPKVRLRIRPSLLPKQIELQATPTEIQWRYVGYDWTDLLAISEIAASVAIGTVTTLAAGSSATVTNSGTAQNPVLNFGIPKGADGVVASITAGTGISVNSADPAHPVVSSTLVGLTDGDKGDIVVSGTGATWTIDSAVLSTFMRTVLDDTTQSAALVTLGAFPIDGSSAMAGDFKGSTSVNVTTSPPIQFSGDANTGIGHSAADTLDFTTGGVDRFQIASDGSRKSVIPSGSTLLPLFDCRAWVNFNGVTTTSIRGSGNVSSLTDNGTGDTTINFTTSMPDANYAIVACGKEADNTTGNSSTVTAYKTGMAAGSCQIITVNTSQAKTDFVYVGVAIFR